MNNIKNCYGMDVPEVSFCGVNDEKCIGDEPTIWFNNGTINELKIVA